MALLAASGGDKVKLFDVSAVTEADQGDRDPCTSVYSPSPGSQVNSLKWNHTNLVVASAGDDKKISLWHKNGHTLGTLPIAGTNAGDNISESISVINFSNRSSRYICSGGSGQVVRIWDLQRKRCIKWLKGHTDTITGAMYNCKDEHLASVSLRGDLILHNLASGARVTKLKDPNQQALRVLDYSRISRHLLVTAGDDGSIHLWDATGSSPKVSWQNQHSAPTTAVSFSPSNDKVIASVGLDKKLYTLDSGSKRPTFLIPYEAPFSSLAFRDDGWTLAAGTNNGRVIFYDVRGKPQPITSLRAYSNSEAVTSLCWQRSKPSIVTESNCTGETALLGGVGEDSILMPDPLPFVTLTSSSLSLAAGVPGSRSLDAPSVLSAAEETPNRRNHLWTGATLLRLHASQTTNFKDDMDVFSPLKDVQPITPSLDKLCDDHDEAKKDTFDRKPASLLYPSSMRRFPYVDEGGNNSHPIYDWKSNSTAKQDDTKSSSSLLKSTPTTSSRSEDSLPATPPESWGGEGLPDKFDNIRQPFSYQSRFGMSTSGSMAGLHSSNVETSGIGERAHFSSMSASVDTKITTGHANLDSPTSAFSRRFPPYAVRIGTNLSFSDGAPLTSDSPKAKKTGTETRKELSSLLRPDISSSTRGGGPSQSDLQQSTSSFTLQLVQRTLEETLASVQKSIHDDMRNLHVDVLRQFHIHETEVSSLMNSVLEKQAELLKEVESLRKENQQLRQLL